ncbi:MULTISPECIES: SURF1 family protein [Legionella]|uniref:SURF1-like protein n=1 Tax=Legionella drozanskii LLAP-1 TaxID=1212489 RepID=A0A0W0SVY5_9GAMM|nr:MULTISPECIES: SURF1 family protein [Legionella]KTC87551.1 SURF1 family protein [Legionella drozanskii LLAP-1]PJE17842.1 MAG: SURF1 family protein [Legionella sp.]
MVSLTCFNRRFTPKWWMVILSCLFIAVFLRLGFWQLARAEEKKQMLAVQANFAQQAPIIWKSGAARPEQYQQLQVAGNFLPQILLLDNQHYQHQFGYHVLNPLQLNDNQVVLIDRGWVAGDLNRELLPKITVPTAPLALKGYAYYPSDKNWVLGPAYERKKDNVTIIERIDTKLIGQFLHKSVYPFIIRLDKDNAQGYVREWSIVAMPPERHYAYALQWFAMALVILILFIALNLMKKYD